MKTRTLFLIIVLLTVSLTAQENVSGTDPWETALNAVGLTKSTLTFDYGDMSNYGGDKFVLPLFYTLHSSPFKVETYTKLYRDNLLRNCRSLKNLSAFCSGKVNENVRRGLIGNPLDQIKPKLADEYPLAEAIIAFEKNYAIPMDQNKRKELKEKSAELPCELQEMAAMIIYSAIDSLDYHSRAFDNVRKNYNLNEISGQLIEFLASEAEAPFFDLEPFIEAVDFKYLFTPAQDIAMGVDFVVDSLSRLTFDTEFNFEWKTSAGKIVINDNRANNYGTDEYFLILDAGGNDSYKNGAANMTSRNWISILIDMNGDDVYKSDENTIASFGSGILGYAYLVDMAGNDTYSAHNVSMGAGFCGVGILQDLAGDDSYDGYVCGQGCGFLGQGVLADLSGDDRYHLYQMGQGMGFTKGIGLLVDSCGNDMYIAEDSIIDFASSQTPEHNSSLCQGVGFGKRADFVDGHSWAGGIGMLVDGFGDDRYSAGLFAQGCAYWYAIGLLCDMSGRDIYDGVWYVQGSGAHFGLGIMLESSGDDSYTATHNMAQGAGHDFTLGMLIDEAGDDIHNAPNLSLGGGNANGFGIFLDKAGDDSYNVTAVTTLGRANIASRGGLRDHIKCLGLFLDLGGNDSYPVQYDFAKNNTLWKQTGKNTDDPLPDIELGVGYDTEAK